MQLCIDELLVEFLVFFLLSYFLIQRKYGDIGLKGDFYAIGLTILLVASVNIILFWITLLVQWSSVWLGSVTGLSEVHFLTGALLVGNIVNEWYLWHGEHGIPRVFGLGGLIVGVCLLLWV